MQVNISLQIDCEEFECGNCDRIIHCAISDYLKFCGVYFQDKPVGEPRSHEEIWFKKRCKKCLDNELKSK
jgi:hypothetical protein